MQVDIAGKSFAGKKKKIFTADDQHRTLWLRQMLRLFGSEKPL
jgi:hypothetical protein